MNESINIREVVLCEVMAALERTGPTPASASREACGNPRPIKNMLAGHTPKVDSLKRLAKVLELEFCVGSPRSGRSNDPPSYSEIAGALGLPEAAIQEEILAEIASLAISRHGTFPRLDFQRRADAAFTNPQRAQRKGVTNERQGQARRSPGRELAATATTSRRGRVRGKGRRHRRGEQHRAQTQAQAPTAEQGRMMV